MSKMLGPYALGRVHHADCLDAMRMLPDGCVDAVVTDPPYGLKFMGVGWDTFEDRKGSKGRDASVVFDKIGGNHNPTCAADSARTRRVESIRFGAWCVGWSVEALRVAKPGAHLLAFGGTRTFHRLTCAIEDAGWEVRDCLSWLYGQGFPKSLDVSKAIDREAGAEREVVGRNTNWRSSRSEIACPQRETQALVTAAATSAARKWSGWGTALKPAWESIIVAQKPLDVPSLCSILAHRIGGLVCQLPSSAKRAAESLSSSRVGQGAGFGSALSDAVRRCSTPDDSFDLMGTLPSGSEIPSSLSIAWSWLTTLADLSTAVRTFTTETESATTTDLRTLSCLLSKITADDITEAASCGHGTGSSVWLADAVFCGVAARLALTRDPSVAESATSSVAGRALRPNWLPIILARKPLCGTVAQNVQAHGTGAINVDGCRIGRAKFDRFEYGVSGDEAPSESPAHGAIGRLAYSAHDAGRWPANLVLDEFDEQILRLTSGLPVAMMETIGRYFRGYQLPGLQRAVRDVSEPKEESQGAVLLPGVLRQAPVGDNAGVGALHVREEAQRPLAGIDATHDEGEREARTGKPIVQGIVGVERIPHPERGRTSGGTENPRVADGVEGPQGDSGTPPDDGDQTRATVAVIGGGTSQERDQGRQQAGKPGSTRQLDAQDGAQTDPCRVARAPRRERTLEVLACDVPSGWLDLFQPTGRSVRSPRCSAEMLDEQSGETTSGRLLTHHHRTGKSKVGTFDIRDRTGEECDWGGDTGGVSRFFYTAKATRAERGEGNNHPTVKPLDLMRWLVRLVTPTGGIVLDPFSGSGTTGCAARLEGFRFVGFDTDEHYCEIANARIAATGERLGEVRPETAKIAQQVGMFTASGYVSPATRRSISSVHFQQQRGVTREDTRGSRVVSFARRGRVVGSGR